MNVAASWAIESSKGIFCSCHPVIIYFASYLSLLLSKRMNDGEF